MATRVITARIPRVRHHSPVYDFIRGIDYVLLGAIAATIGYGLWILADVSRDDVPGDPWFHVTRQGVALGVGLIGFVLAMLINPNIYRRFGSVFYIATIGLIATVFFAGTEIRGSRRWIEFGSYQFQPSELAKVFLVLFLASFLAARAKQIGKARTIAAAVALAAVPIVFVFEQPDFGTAIVLVAAAMATLFVAGIRWLHLGVIAAMAVAAGLAVLWFLPSGGVEVLEPYQRDRLTGFVNPDLDPAGTTYNITQSITAIGSGGLTGRGVSGATQTSLNYLPEHSNDFIFSSLAEQRGFFGAAILLALFAIIIWRGVRIITIAPSLYTAIVAGGITFALLFQIFVNVGMTLGIAPITGIPLPLVSAGGSSVIATLVMLGLLEAIHVRGRSAHP